MHGLRGQLHRVAERRRCGTERLAGAGDDLAAQRTSARRADDDADPVGQQAPEEQPRLLGELLAQHAPREGRVDLLHGRDGHAREQQPCDVRRPQAGDVGQRLGAGLAEQRGQQERAAPVDVLHLDAVHGRDREHVRGGRAEERRHVARGQHERDACADRGGGGRGTHGAARARDDHQELLLEQPHELLGRRLGVAPAQARDVLVHRARRQLDRPGEGLLDDAGHGAQRSPTTVRSTVAPAVSVRPTVQCWSIARCTTVRRRSRAAGSSEDRSTTSRSASAG